MEILIVLLFVAIFFVLPLTLFGIVSINISNNLKETKLLFNKKESKIELKLKKNGFVRKRAKRETGRMILIERELKPLVVHLTNNQIQPDSSKLTKRLIEH